MMNMYFSDETIINILLFIVFVLFIAFGRCCYISGVEDERLKNNKKQAVIDSLGKADQ